MKIALLHYTFWPEIGGVEHLMRDQANMLRHAGHEVTVVTGIGRETGEDFRVVVLPEMAPEFELNAAVRAVLQRGQADQNLNKYRAVLVKALGQVLAEIDVTIVHNVFTMHYNLGLTLALRDLASEHRMIAWTSDLVATDSDHFVPNPTKPPWNFMRWSVPDLLYVGVSDLRAEEIVQTLQPKVEAISVPNIVDVARVFGLTPEIRASLDSLNLASRDLILLMPSPLLVRKNIEFALRIVQQLVDLQLNPLLIVTGGRAAHSESAEKYGEFLRQSLPGAIQGNVVFVNDFFPVQDDTLRDLFLLADCLLFPSRQEGFGLPIVEAGLHRLPVWCAQMPAYAATQGEGCFLLEGVDQVAEAVDWLQAQPTFRSHRTCRKLFDPGVVYREFYEPLLAAFPRTKLL